jgi:SAM-dependent methyltransferase
MSADNEQFDKRARARELAAEFEAKGDQLGWFDALYRESGGDVEKIPWADLTPNEYFETWAKEKKLAGNGRKALVVGCGLGDDARFLRDLDFKVSAFDISPTAIAWARKLHADTDIQFEVMDLFQPFRGWLSGFEFVLEIYTIQPLPLEMRPRVIDAISCFVAPGGSLVVVTRGRENDEETEELPWPLSRQDLRRFADNGLTEVSFTEMSVEDDGRRFVVEYNR